MFYIAVVELFSGQRPFHKLSPMQIMTKDTQKQSHPDIPAEMPIALAQLLHDCMQFDPEKRPTAKAVLTRLQELRESSASDAQPWLLPRELAHEPLVWQDKPDGLRFVELDGKASLAQQRHLECIRSMCANVNVTQYSVLSALCKTTGFRPVNYAKDKEMDMQFTRRMRDLPGIRGIGWFFNGTSEAMAWKMCTSGLINYRVKDAGYFGSGIYLTPQAEYAAM